MMWCRQLMLFFSPSLTDSDDTVSS